jgi:20S proteasome alpha/beta subunit
MSSIMHDRSFIPKLYNLRSLPKTRQSMTIGIGIMCEGGIVLCADRQITLAYSYKYPETKISEWSGNGWIVAMTYAGVPARFFELSKHIESHLYAVSDDEITSDYVRNGVVDALKKMGDLASDNPSLALIIAVSTIMEQPQMFCFQKSQVDLSDGFACIGIGDSALIRHLSTRFLHQHRKLNFGVGLALYMVKKAEDHIDGCGGPSDLLILRTGGNYKWIQDTQITKMEAEIAEGELRMCKEFGLNVLTRVDW